MSITYNLGEQPLKNRDRAFYAESFALTDIFGLQRLFRMFHEAARRTRILSVNGTNTFSTTNFILLSNRSMTNNLRIYR